MRKNNNENARKKEKEKVKDQARKQQKRMSAAGPTSDRPSVVTIMSHQYSWAGGVALHTAMRLEFHDRWDTIHLPLGHMPELAVH